MALLDAYAPVLSLFAREAGQRVAVRVFGTRQRRSTESVRLTQEELAAIVATAVDGALEAVRDHQISQAQLLAIPAASGRPS